MNSPKFNNTNAKLQSFSSTSKALAITLSQDHRELADNYDKTKQDIGFLQELSWRNILLCDQECLNSIYCLFLSAFVCLMLVLAKSH